MGRTGFVIQLGTLLCVLRTNERLCGIKLPGFPADLTAVGLTAADAGIPLNGRKLSGRNRFHNSRMPESVNHDIPDVGFGLDAFREILTIEVQKGGAGSGLAGQSLTSLGKAPLHERHAPRVLDCVGVPDSVPIEPGIVLDIVGVGRGFLHAQLLPRNVQNVLNRCHHPPPEAPRQRSAETADRPAQRQKQSQASSHHPARQRCQWSRRQSGQRS